MIIPELKLNFIHIPKCAGSSIELSILNKLTHSDYTDTKQVSEEHKLRYHLYYGEIQHSPASKLPNFDGWRTFTVVRNPWDRIVSEFYWRTWDKQTPKKFKDFVLTLPQKEYKPMEHFKPMVWFLDDNREVDIFKMENMTMLEDYLNMPIMKSNQSAGRKIQYRDEYNKLTKYVIDHIYEEDIKTFEYEY